jgi:hypothetical protein
MMLSVILVPIECRLDVSNHQYRDANREDLLELVESLLVEREDYSTAVAQLQVEVTSQRIQGFNLGYYCGYRDGQRARSLS